MIVSETKQGTLSIRLESIDEESRLFHVLHLAAERYRELSQINVGDSRIAEHFRNCAEMVESWLTTLDSPRVDALDREVR